MATASVAFGGGPENAVLGGKSTLYGGNGIRQAAAAKRPGNATGTQRNEGTARLNARALGVRQQQERRTSTAAVNVGCSARQVPNL